MSNESNANVLGSAVAGKQREGIGRALLWNEMSDQQKMDAMRSEIRSLHYTIRRLLKTEEAVNGHIHSPSGEVFVPVNNGRNEVYGYSHETLK